MIRKESTSRAFASYGYDAASEVLEIQYHSGHIYQHRGIPAEVFAAFEAAPSMGSYLNTHIKPEHPAVAVILCDRCSHTIEGISGHGVTGGYYDVRPPSSWSDYANPGERFVCDSCMWGDPRYIAVYGAPINVEEVPAVSIRTFAKPSWLTPALLNSLVAGAGATETAKEID